MADTFGCHRCGTCCTNLREAWDREPGTASTLPDDRIHRLPRPGGLRVFAWEAPRFPTEHLSPLLVVPDDRRERLIALAYELDADACPNYDASEGCTIYEDRPLVCQAYPLLVVENEQGPQLTVSADCPARVQAPEPSHPDEDPVKALARAYPEEVGPALAVPAALTVLPHALDLLETADLLRPRRGLDAPTLEAWSNEGIVDLVELGEQGGVFTAETFRDRVDRIKQDLRDRFPGAPS